MSDSSTDVAAGQPRLGVSFPCGMGRESSAQYQKLSWSLSYYGLAIVVVVVIDTRSAHKLRGAGVYCHAASADIVDYRLYKGFRIFLRQAS